MDSPVPSAAMHQPSRLRRSLWVLLRIFGWKSFFVLPPAKKGIVIVYPHTSNWDFIIGLLFEIGAGLSARWIGKHTLFRWPVRSLFMWLGGIPIDRREPAGGVRALLAEFAKQDWMWLALAPEGTRSHTDHWKSGFYRIAVAGGLPVGLGFIDYATRRVGIDTYITLSGDVEQDFARIRAFYANKRGGRPENASDIRLREKDPAR